MTPTGATPHYTVSPNAVFEAFEDEVIIINMLTGSYFALDEVALNLWTLVQEGNSLPSIIATTQARYEGDADTIETSIKAFLADLEKEGLLVCSEVPPVPTQAPTPVEGASPRPFQKPTLSKFTDMEDLLLLDPIHEVDEMGWPHAKAAPTPEA